MMDHSEFGRIETQAIVYMGDVYEDDWVVWSLDDDGAVITTVFSGSDAEARALEYAALKYASVERRDPPAQRSEPRRFRIVGGSE